VGAASPSLDKLADSSAYDAGRRVSAAAEAESRIGVGWAKRQLDDEVMTLRISLEVRNLDGVKMVDGAVLSRMGYLLEPRTATSARRWWW